MDCPAEKVLEVVSAHGHLRVTIEVVVCSRPEPFYYPDVEHLDGTLKYRAKLGRKSNSVAKELGGREQFESPKKVMTG